MVTSILRKAGTQLKRLASYVFPVSIFDGAITINKDETVCDVQCEISKESHETEKISYICLPCEVAVEKRMDSCTSRSGVELLCQDELTQGTDSNVSERLRSRSLLTRELYF